MGRLLKVRDQAGLVRDEISQAILSTDNRQLTEYKAARQARRSDRERIAALEERLELTRSEVNTKLDAILHRLGPHGGHRA